MAVKPVNGFSQERVDAVEKSIDDSFIECSAVGQLSVGPFQVSASLTEEETNAVIRLYRDAGWGHVHIERSPTSHRTQVTLYAYEMCKRSDIGGLIPIQPIDEV